MLTAVKGTYKDGKAELSETPPDIKEADVVVTFLGNGEKTRKPQMLQFGKYAGGRETTEEDFKIAEFHGDPDDGLDWK